ncbi:hypothetical protein LTR36_003578 [Oleoguttula mirabilis]|uniref:Uncharacterized protein n=1 Tax=Oleoguttula mirabilis TaxID=1507867 RepID=A0AAV9JIC1_9PEZI|nr:hypothetical protein LTR36_003578 [Oleoguttula mirabilis]
MPKLEFAPDYHACTITELQHLIKARTGQSAKRNHAKRFYISILRQADRDTVFQFLDLPSELRNLVYRELLTLTYDDGDKSCFPQILATSRQVHGEAEGILYGDTPVEVSMTIGAQYIRHSQRTVAGTCRIVVDTKKHDEQMVHTLHEAFDEWPAYLRKMHHIKLKVGFGEQDGNAAGLKRALMTANHVFFSLVAHLAVSHQLKDIKLEIESGGIPEFERHATQVLSPLTKLGLAMSGTLTIDGALSRVADNLQQRLQVHDKPQVTTLRRCRRLEEKAKDVRSAAKGVGETRKFDALALGLFQLKLALDTDDYVDEYRERVLKDAATAVQKLLDGGLLEEVRRAVEVKVERLQRMLEKLT